MSRALLMAALAVALSGCGEAFNNGCPSGVWAVHLHSQKASDTTGWKGVIYDTTGATELRTLGWSCGAGSREGYWCCLPPARRAARP